MPSTVLRSPVSETPLFSGEFLWAWVLVLTLNSLDECWNYFGFQGGPVEILSFLYLGSAYHASRKDMLDALGITALINVSANCPNHFEGHYQYKSIPVEDNHKADISSWFNEAIDFIGKWNTCLGLLPLVSTVAVQPHESSPLTE